MRPSDRFKSYIRFYRNLRVVGISALAALAAFMTLAAYPIVRVAQTAEALTGNPASTILTITSTSPSANLDLVVKDTDGTFDISSDNARFNVITDNYTGYTLSIASDNDDGQLINNISNTSFDSIAHPTTLNTFSNSSDYNGKWGYSPSKYNSVDNYDLLPAPTTDGATIDITGSANNEPNEYTIALGARADYNVVPGTYTNTFVLTAIANKIPFTINFNDNTGDSTVANLPTTISDPTGITETSVALPQTIPTRTGYTFAGWCDTVTTINSNGSTTCTNPTTGQTGIVYPASTATTTSYLDFIDQTASSNIANLYAMWNIESYTITITNSNTTSDASSLTIPFNGSATVTATPNSGYYLSAVSCPTGYTCTGYNTGSSYTEQQTVTITNNGTAGGGALGFAATPSTPAIQDITYSACTTNYQTVHDSRDGQEYIIQRLADGNCWMMTNLNLGAVTLSTDLTSSNTNLSTTITAADFNSYKKTRGTATYTAAEYIPVSGNDTGSGAPGTPYGTLYNYCAASAGTYCYSSSETTPASATYDICPKGWRLPTGGSSGEFQNLYNQSAYNSSANMRKSYTQGGAAFALAGYFDSSKPDDQGSRGLYWSSTRYNNTLMHYMFLYTSGVYPADSYYRNYGHSIRCILDTTPYEKLQAGALSMQDIGNLSAPDTSTLISQMPQGTQYNTTDSRDGQTYTITKINNQMWMTQNLRFTGTSIDSSTTNINTTKTLSYGDLTSGNSYTEPRIHNSGNATTGVWYNYCAASAGTICTDSDTTEASYSLCPAGWRLPTSSEQVAITSYLSAYSPVAGGYYISGSLSGTSNGYWWSSSATDDTLRRRLLWNGSSLGTGSSFRYGGYYIRCVRSS